ncbi:MAG TPA: VWA domain-containing protein [Candidatus Coprocola pullicola]|nr:VWA domain-containing protein [Candidatus Coprocola pullicola]
MKTLLMGQKIPFSQLSITDCFEIEFSFSQSSIDPDVSCFCVNSDNQLSDDRYFIFYNQLCSAHNEIVKEQKKDSFTVSIQQLPSFIHRMVFTASVESGSFSNIPEGSLFLKNSKTGEIVADYHFCSAQFEKEKAIILAECYIYQGQWKFSIVARGFNGGLRELLKHYGGEETVSPPTQTPPKVSLSKSEKVQKAVFQKAPHLIDLTKKAIVTLEKQHLQSVTAKVLLVLDRSGSMHHQYQNGKVQRLLDKVLPLALLFDDDGILESWAFASTYCQLEDITLENIHHYIVNHHWKKWDIGGTNNEPAIMQTLYEKHKNSSEAVYILFVSDGGVAKSGKIKKIIVEASSCPIFWQFVGIGGKNYGILEKLDTMEGRFIDNANFFALDDIDSISDEQLYERLMGEFPIWLKQAKQKNILP